MIVAAPAASAQAAGQWTAYAGVARISPQVASGDLSQPSPSGSRADVGAGTGAVFGGAYGLTDNVSVELDLGLPFRHKLYGAGALAGMGELGTVKVLPPTVLLQYRWFDPHLWTRPARRP
jgi:outer membrane protein